MSKFGSTEKCVVCVKTVYPNDRLAADEKIFHKACFRCSVCNNQLKLGNYASKDNGTLFDKVCFKKLFFSKGNYSEGFGQLLPQKEHELKKNGGVPVTPVCTTSSTPEIANPEAQEEITASS